MPSILYLIWFFVSGVLLAAPSPTWRPLTSANQKQCSAETPCRVTTENGNFEVLFQTEDREGMQKFLGLNIKNLKTGAIDKFNLDEMNNLAPTDFFKLFEVSFRPGAKHDLALHAYNSAREGEAYYYFLYDSKNRKYHLSNGTYPKLHFDEKKKAYVTEIQGNVFKLEKSLSFTPVSR